MRLWKKKSNACGEQSIETLVETGSASHLWLRGCHPNQFGIDIMQEE